MHYSKFLPADYDPTIPIAILAGRGEYPAIMADRMLSAGVQTRLIAMGGETDDEVWNKFPDDHRSIIKIGQIKKLLKILQQYECKYAVMVGQIRPGKLFSGIHPDLKALSILKNLKERNAESIYSAVVAEMGQIGVHTLDARVFIDDQMASPGLMTKGPFKIDPETLEHGIRIANEVARLDIGQGIVVKQGTVLCVEEFDGTDAMLKRAQRFSTDGKLFVKTVKPNQNYAIDVPVFGERTIQSMLEGGIKYAALAADRTIMLNKPQVIAAANKAKIQLFGFSD